RRGRGRARIFARSHRRAQGARPHRGGGIAAHLGQFDSGDARRPRRRRRQPHPRRPRRGVLKGDVFRWIESLAPPVSCPAEAGHPAITENPVVTGSPAFAGDDDREVNDPSENHHALASAASCFETHRSAVELVAGCAIACTAMLLSMRPRDSHFSEALLATSTHLAISLLRKAPSFSGEPPT